MVVFIVTFRLAQNSIPSGLGCWLVFSVGPEAAAGLFSNLSPLSASTGSWVPVPLRGLSPCSCSFSQADCCYLLFIVRTWDFSFFFLVCLFALYQYFKISYPVKTLFKIFNDKIFLLRVSNPGKGEKLFPFSGSLTLGFHLYSGSR